MLLDQEDAASYKQGEEVTLLRWGNVTITAITTDAGGKVTALKVTYLCFVCVCESELCLGQIFCV